MVDENVDSEREKNETLMEEKDDTDDEDVIERFEFEIENSVDKFIDEIPVNHDVYPDSESDAEESDMDSGIRERNYHKRGDGRLAYGQTFFNGIAFKEAVLDYALRTGENIKQYRWDKTKLGYDCAMPGDCKWRIYCSLAGKKNKWQVKVFNDYHSCIPNGECEMLKGPVIARLFVDRIRDDPEGMKPQKIEEIIKERWKIIANRTKCQSARLKALKWIDEEYKEQFAHLRDYGKEIVNANPESVVEINTFTNDLGEEVFNSFYVCFDILFSENLGKKHVVRS